MTAQALTDLMVRHKLNVKGVADLLYVSRRCVAHWKKGDRAIPKLAWESLLSKLQRTNGTMSLGDSWNVR